jgi:FkbM family methyltransferase
MKLSSRWVTRMSALAHRRPPVRLFEDQIYDAVLRPDDHCVDVGANVGEISARMAQLAGASGSVLAFEPVWPMYRELCRRLRRLSRAAAPVVTVPMGLSDAEREATIQVPDGDFGQGSMAGSAQWQQAHPGASLQSYLCRFTTLDQMLAAARWPTPDFIKIDVEGAELFVLQGAKEHFASGARPLMLIELYAPWERAFGYGPYAVLSLLAALGYLVLFACPQGLVPHVPTEQAPFPAAYVDGYNIIAYVPAVHQERIEALAGLHAGGATPKLPMTPAPMPNRP